MEPFRFKFISEKQKEFFFLNSPRQCYSGGYGNGKTTALCAKAITLASTFPNYRIAIFRKGYVDLKNTTRVTFFKICPMSFYDESQGGKRVDSHGYVRFTNGSEILWLHSDNCDENVIRGLEINSVIVDQSEEIDENIAAHMDARVGRWDGAKLPPHLDTPDFPRHPVSGLPVIPSYFMHGCNPDAYDHWIYMQYHPDSPEYNVERYNPRSGTYESYADTNKMVQASSYDNPFLPERNLRSMESRGKDFRRRFVKGEWGITSGTIHEISPLSVLENIDIQFIRTIITKGTLHRAFDHGEASPSCCLWFSYYKDWLFCYREYYKANGLISEHRAAINKMGILQSDPPFAERYSSSVADPQIFKKTFEKYGGRWSVAEEYRTPKDDQAPIFWQPADNNEFVTRDRVNEILAIDDSIEHPITGKCGAPGIYFIKQSKEWPRGCNHVISETRSQKRKSLGVINNEVTYSDEREASVSDHAYDCLRYEVARGGEWKPEDIKRNLEGTFFGLRQEVMGINKIGPYAKRRMPVSF